MRDVRGAVFPALALFLVLAVPALAAGPAAKSVLLPENPAMNGDYKPGLGSPAGKVLDVAGRVVLMHGADPLTGYWVRRGMDVYESDVLVALESGRARVGMAAGGEVALAPETRVGIGRAEAGEKGVSLFFNLSLGRARFTSAGAKAGRPWRVAVKTDTALCLSTGPDLVVEADREKTDVTALADTEVTVRSLSVPAALPMTLAPMTRASITAAAPPQPAVQVEKAQVPELVKPFEFPAKPTKP